jgi:hypothetical protein
LRAFGVDLVATWARFSIVKKDLETGGHSSAKRGFQV